MTTTRYEYRVSYRRRAWAPGSLAVRWYATPAGAAQLVDKLQAGGRPDLSPLERLQVDRRPVTTWEPYPISRLPGTRKRSKRRR